MPGPRRVSSLFSPSPLPCELGLTFTVEKQTQRGKVTSPRSHSQERGSQDLDPDCKVESRGVQSGGLCGCFQHDPEDQQGWEERAPGVAGEGGTQNTPCGERTTRAPTWLRKAPGGASTGKDAGGWGLGSAAVWAVAAGSRAGLALWCHDTPAPSMALGKAAGFFP